MSSKKPLELHALRGALREHFGKRVRTDEPLARHTTLQLGGPADLFVTAQSADELVMAVSLAETYGVPVFILGGGANLVIAETGIRGLVVANHARKITFAGEIVRAESGAILPRLSNLCAERGLSGMEWAVGVPGTLGGAVVNNAGAYGTAIADVLIRAELLPIDGSRVWRSADWFEYDYRTSRLKRGAVKGVVLQAELRLTPAPTAEIIARMQTFTARRKSSQPPGATVGSMFKNPPGDFAGRLIEAAGLKGFRVGQAEISPKHANFFINLGGASADDVITLINTARDTVQQKFGVTLELEIEIITEKG